MDVTSIFDSILREQPQQAVTIAAILTLVEVVKKSQSATAMGLREEVEAAIKILKKKNPQSVSLVSGCNLFCVFVENLGLHSKEFSAYRRAILERADYFAQSSLSSRTKISETSEDYISENASILTHGYSRAVCCILKRAVRSGKHFRVILCEGKPSRNSYKTLALLNEHKVPVKFVFDSGLPQAVAECDFALVGAEGISENGGVISQIGTLSIALMAKVYKKPFYVSVETYKFTRIYPLGQSDVTQGKHVFPLVQQTEKMETEKFEKLIKEMAEKAAVRLDCKDGLKENRAVSNSNVELSIPRLDYTSPELITLLFTDIGAKNTSAVSEELIKLYH